MQQVKGRERGLRADESGTGQGQRPGDTETRRGQCGCSRCQRSRASSRPGRRGGEIRATQGPWRPLDGVWPSSQGQGEAAEVADVMGTRQHSMQFGKPSPGNNGEWTRSRMTRNAKGPGHTGWRSCDINDPKTPPPYSLLLWSRLGPLLQRWLVPNAVSYTSNSFKYSPNRRIFSHLEPACFAYPMKLHPTSATHE